MASEFPPQKSQRALLPSLVAERSVVNEVVQDESWSIEKVECNQLKEDGCGRFPAERIELTFVFSRALEQGDKHGDAGH